MAILSELLEQRVKLPEQYEKRSFESLEWFKQRLRVIRLDQQDLMLDDDLIRETQAYPRLGEMYIYFYGAKWDKKLPYWDKFPVVIPYKYMSDGWYGINLHYIAPRYRVRLLDAMYGSIEINETTGAFKRDAISYERLISATVFRYAKPCIKRYLTSQLKSPLFQVPPKFWDMIALLPLQDFNINANKVYAQSRKQF